MPVLTHLIMSASGGPRAYLPGDAAVSSSSSPCSVSVGSRLGPWQCRAKLGTGSFGIVHVWRHNETEETLALKRCRFGPEVLLSDKHKEMWRQEVDIMQRLEHPNVVRCRVPPAELAATGGDSQLPLLCMEFCEGGDLRNQLNKPRNCVGLEQTEVLGCASDLASALGFLHNRRIIHRDLKPENVVLQESSDPDRRFVYKLIDLGYAKELGQSSLALSFVGTLQYIAPELFLSHEYTKSVDYWSLGFLCFEVATGQRPFLPNLSPGQWMEPVSKKSHNVICIHESLEQEVAPGEDRMIQSMEHLLPENHLSKSLCADVAVWLRTLLEWNPRQRGRKSADGEVSLFSDLGAILAKKRVATFCPDRGDLKLDYVVVPTSTIGADLANWMERDCGVPASEQLIVTDYSQAVEREDYLDRIAKVYVFHFPSQIPVTDRVKLVSLQVPQAVKAILKSPRAEVSYPRRKQVVLHAYYFVRQEYQVIRELHASLKVLVSFVLRRIKEVGQACRLAAANHESAKSKYAFFRDSLHHDLEKYRQQIQRRDHITSNQMFESWINSEAELDARCADLAAGMKAAEEATSLFFATGPKAKAVLDEEMVSDPDPLGEYVEKSLRLVEDLRRIPVEGRREKESVLEVAQVVVKVLKRRDRFLHDNTRRRLEVLDCHRVGLEAAALATNAAVEADAFCVAVTKLQRRRQSDLWKLLAAAVQQASSSPSHKAASLASLGPDQREETDRAIEENRELRGRFHHMMKLTQDAMNSAMNNTS